MFRRGETYKHINCLDMAIYVTGVLFPSTTEPFVLDVIYWNTHYNSCMHSETDTVVIKREDAHKWIRIEE